MGSQPADMSVTLAPYTWGREGSMVAKEGQTVASAGVVRRVIA